MSGSTMAALFLCVFALPLYPILAAAIEFGPAPSLPPVRAPGFSGQIGNGLTSGAANRVILLDGQALLELGESDECERISCLADRFESLHPWIQNTGSKRDRALALIDEQLLELFHGSAVQRSSVEGLFWRAGLSIADD